MSSTFVGRKKERRSAGACSFINHIKNDLRSRFLLLLLRLSLHFLLPSPLTRRIFYWSFCLYSLIEQLSQTDFWQPLTSSLQIFRRTDVLIHVIHACIADPLLCSTTSSTLIIDHLSPPYILTTFTAVNGPSHLPDNDVLLPDLPRNKLSN